ncbi:MAG: DUF3422 family protein [Methanocellales archaeon]
MPPKVDRNKCTNCGLCSTICPSNVYGIIEGRAEVINPQNCIECGECVKKCPEGAITLIEDLHRQISRAILEYIPLPSHVNVVCYTLNGRDRYSIKEEFKKIALKVGFLESEITWQKNNAFGVKKTGNYTLLIKLSFILNYYAYQFWIAGESEISFGKLELLKSIVFPSDSKLSELDILLSDKEFSRGEIARLLQGGEIFAGEYTGNVKIFTKFEPDGEGRERYLVFSSRKESLERQAESIIDNLMHMENYFHLIALPREKYEVAVYHLGIIEKEISTRFRVIKEELDTASAQVIREWLIELMARLANTANISEEFRHLLAEAVLYGESLQNLLQSWKGEPVEGYSLISTPLLRGWISIKNDYQRFVERVKEIRDEISDIIAILNMRINLTAQEQSYKLLQGMHETQKTQMNLQRTMEGLYVVFAAFYLTELGHFIFEALEVQGIVHIPSAVLTVLFIPVALLIGLIISGKLRWKKIK